MSEPSHEAHYPDAHNNLGDALAEIRQTLESPKRGRPVLVEISAGELIDKLTILEIKTTRIRDPKKLSNVRSELAATQAAFTRSIDPSDQLNALIDKLKIVNLTLWELEDEIRVCEHAGEFGPRFVEVARQVYIQNDRRASLKRQINDLLGSRFVEEKSYGEE